MSNRPKSASKARKSSADHYVPKLDLFAKEFKSEAHLRTVLADLLRKMGHTGVRITHGATEKGKDIVFYGEGPLGEKRLFACVVKNEPITGQADDLTSGAPTLVHQIQGVLNQTESAFSEPLANGRGTDERVDTVYIISPYECSQPTIDSVKTRLQRSGQITFKCGPELLDLFAKYWPEFLWFGSTVLLSYLSVLRKGLEEDYALASLILQKSYLATSPGSLADLYVEPEFYAELRKFRLAKEASLNLDLLSGSRSLSEVRDRTTRATQLSKLLRTSPIWSDNPDSAVNCSEQVLAVATKISELWQAAYRKYIAELREEARQKQSTYRTFAASGAFTTGDLIVPSERRVSVELQPTAKFQSDANAVQQAVSLALRELQEKVSTASKFAEASHPNSIMTLGKPDFLAHCQVAETASFIPQLFITSTPNRLFFSEDLLHDYSGPLLITGPAGFGKTTFCRWHAIQDAEKLVQKNSTTLPVYLALHSLSRGQLGTFEDAFFLSDELKKLVQQQALGQASFDRVRLYLDGLDEVTSTERQQEIMRLAQQVAEQRPFVQVIVTGRDHVGGGSLRWIPRIRLCELSDAKSRILAERWLEPREVDVFFERLQKAGNLADLMRVPLLATLILAVYRKTGSVPPNKTNLYSLFVELLCGGWDFYKNIQRRASTFSVRDKEIVLARLAGILQHEEKRTATDADFRTAVKNSIRGLASDWEQFLQDIVEDGLLVRVGTDLTFSHLSFQEFLTARDLRDHMGHRPKQTLSWYLNGRDWWREVLSFYITLSDRPAETDEWLIERALKSTSAVTDLEERVQTLRSALKAAFPAYEDTSSATILLSQLKSKAQRLGQKGLSADE
jgi:hypothetical protein